MVSDRSVALRFICAFCSISDPKTLKQHIAQEFLTFSVAWKEELTRRTTTPFIKRQVLRLSSPR